MKKILVLHNKYQIYGGEDSNLENEISFLKKSYIVESLIVKNSNKFNLQMAFSFLFLTNFRSNKLLKDTIDEFKPDLVYVHNTWFILNLGIFKILERKKVRTIIKVHNFRYKCAHSFLKINHLKNDLFCKACNFNGRKNLFFNKYFEDSYIKSLFVIYYSKKYLKILKSNKFYIFAISNFHKNKLSELGIESGKVKLMSNPIDILKKNSYNPKSNYIIFAGRLTNEKGLDELLATWSTINLENITLKIVGTGQIYESLLCKYNLSNVEFLGELKNNYVLDLIQKSRAVVTATKMYEGHSRLLSEASSLGVPSIFPKFGSMPEFFPKNYDLSFIQYDYKDLSEKFSKLDDEKLLISLSRKNYDFIQNKLNPNNLISQFEEIFNFEE